MSTENLTKEEIKAKLKEMGIKHHHALGEPKLRALLEQAENSNTTLVHEEEPVESKSVQRRKAIQKGEDPIEGKVAREVVSDEARRTIHELRQNVKMVDKQYKGYGRQEGSAFQWSKGKDKVDIYKGSQFVRTYSKELHGDEYEHLAEKFVKTNNMRLTGEIRKQ